MSNKKHLVIYWGWATGAVWLLSVIIELMNWDKWADPLVTSDISAFVENLLLVILIIPITATILSPVGLVAVGMLVVLFVLAALFNNPTND